MILRLYSKAIHVVQLAQVILAYDFPALSGDFVEKQPDETCQLLC
jgi:hypothetical protein